MGLENFSQEAKEQIIEGALARAKISGRRDINKDRLYQAISSRINKFKCPPVHSLELFLTENCNLRCDYCFVKDKDSFNSMNDETALKSIDFLIKESKWEKSLSILFFGGEPLLKFDLIKKVVGYSLENVRKANKKINFSMTTNGTLFDKEKAIFCKEHNIRYMLSIDGTKEFHDLHRKSLTGESSFEMIMRKFPMLKEIEPIQSVRITPLPDTIPNLFSNIKYLTDLGVNDFTIGTAHGIKWSELDYGIYEGQMKKVLNLYKKLKKEGVHINFNILRKPGIKGENEVSNCKFPAKKRFGCRAGKGYICVAPDGSLFGCSMLLGTNRSFKIGNLDTGLDENLRKELVILNYNRDFKCLSCKYSNYCNGGCIANNYQFSGKFISADKKTCLDTATEIKIMQEFNRSMLRQ